MGIEDALPEEGILTTAFYNGGVRELNTKIKVFTNNLFARRLGFGEREIFEVVGGAA